MDCSDKEYLNSFHSTNKTFWPWLLGKNNPKKKAAPTEEYPRITIVTPSYNQGEFIEETIRSVLLQGYPNLEYIIIDGGSSDDSIEIIKHYERFLTYWVSEPDRGQSHALNKGFSMATGELFGWVNSDDYLKQNALFNIIKLRNRYPNSVAWVGACCDIDRSGNLIRKRPAILGSKEQFGNWGENQDAWIGQPACFFDANIFREVKGIDEKLDYALDVDLWIRLSEKGQFTSTDVVIALERKYPQIKSYQNQPMQQAEHIFIDIKNGLRDAAAGRMNECYKFALDAMLFSDLMGYTFYRIKTVLSRRIRKFLNRWMVKDK